jgi:hypothetical protein
MAGVGDTEKWYQSFKERANFLMVYIEEAHPGNTVEGQQVFAHQSDQERQQLAELCTTSKNLTVPTVLDKLDNAVEIAYAAFPDRIYLLDSNGIVQYKTQPGPRGWDVVEPRAVLDRLLKRINSLN